MQFQFFDDSQINHLFPLTLTRPAADLRVGILTIAEKWLHDFQIQENSNFGFQTRDYLAKKFLSLQSKSASLEKIIYINGKVIPNADLNKQIVNLKPNQKLVKEDLIIAVSTNLLNPDDFNSQLIHGFEDLDSVQCDCDLTVISRPYHIFKLNAQEIQADFDRLTAGRISQTVSSTNTKLGQFPVFLEEGAQVECSILNALDGPIYLGKNTEIMEGSVVRGPLALCEGSKLKLATKVYGGTTLGPFSNVGGEVNNIVIQGYSNKGHDGFLGNAVLGEWCNIGADSNCSNLKNTYDEVKVWNYATRRFDRSGMQFCGLIMGDHSKCGINTMFNTGTVVGVASNLFGAGFPRQFVPDFSWGGASGFVTHKLPAVDKTAGLVMIRRGKEYNEQEQEIMHHLFQETAQERTWESEEN
jgi:UDP-N-acetylglucosamine diphosphorylase/glucosamine-1-phosphate N-acetyltransferase